MHKQTAFITTLIWAISLCFGAPQLTQDSNEDLVTIKETSKPVDCIGVKQSATASESQIVSIYFDTLSLYNNAILQKNSSKQSQEFETHEKPITNIMSNTSIITSTAKPISSSDKPESLQTTVSDLSNTISGSGTAATTIQSSGGSISNDREPSVTPETPVASKTIRQGSDVFCGEANPNGKSNKKLVLDRIVGGRKTEPGEFPFQVRLNIRSRRGSGICGGVILDGQHILTAAHCMTACVSQYLTTATIETTGVLATIGDHSIRSNDGEIEVDIDKIVPHEKYDACNFYANDHDIALIKTKEPIDYRFTTDGYGSINRPCMPASSDITYKEGESVIVSGWGVTRENSGSLSNILRYVQVPFVNVSRCQETYGSRVTNDHVCAGYQSGGKDSCQGDSGGPLVRVVDNRYELVGIVSFGYGCGQPGAPGVYTRVASYIDWIKNNL